MRFFASPIRAPFRALSGLIATAALLTLPLVAYAQETYVALGDSYAFGYTNSGAAPSNGDQGYAAILRDILDDRNGAASVDLVNLAIPGETSSSFFAGTTPLGGGVFDAPLRNPGFNTNYNATPGAFQAQKFSDQVTLLAGQGRQVDYVTLQLGGNDILGLFAQPAFNALPTTSQFGLLINRLETLEANLTLALTSINAAAPNADVSVIGYTDAFAGLGPLNPFNQFGPITFNPFGALGQVDVTGPITLSTLLTLEANARIAAAANANGATYVDIYTPFLGNEATLTQVLTTDAGLPNFHPSPEGYRVIANSIAAPEPGSAALLLIGAVPIIGAVVRRRK